MGWGGWGVGVSEKRGWGEWGVGGSEKVGREGGSEGC